MAEVKQNIEATIALLNKIETKLLTIAKAEKKAFDDFGDPESLKDLKELEKLLEKLKKANDGVGKSQKEQARLNKKLTQLKSEEAKETAKLKIQISEVNKANKEEAKEKLGLVSQYQKLSKELRDNKNKYKELAVQNKQNTVEGRNLLKVIKEQDKKFKDIDRSVGDNTRTIGDYQGAVNSLFPSLNQINGTLTAMKSGVMTLGQGFKGLISTQNKAGKSSVSLGRAMLTIPIFAIIGAFTALVAAFSSTQRGADALSSVLTPVKALFGALLGVLQDVSFWLADKLGEAFNNPTKAIKEFGQMILDNVLNRFKAFSVFMEAIVLFMNGEWAAGLKKGGDAVFQLTTGVTDGTDKLSNFANGMSEVANGAIEAGKRIAELKIEFEKLQIASTVPVQKLKLEFQQLKEIANDQLKSDEERLAALDKAVEKQREISKIESQLLQLRIDRMKEEQSINDTSREEQLELQKLIAEQLVFETTAQKKIAGIRSLASGIEKKALLERQKAQETDAKRRASLIEDDFEKEIALFKLKQEKERAAAKKNNEDLELLEKIHQKELQKIRDKFNKEKIVKDTDVLKSTRKLQTKDGEEALKRADGLDADLKKKEDAKLQREKELEDAALTILENSLNKRSEMKLAALDKEGKGIKDNQKKLEELAAQGDKNALESAAISTKRQAEIEREREQQVRRAQRNEIILAGIKSFANSQDSAKTLTEMAKLVAGLSVLDLPTAFDGVDDTGGRGDVDSKGGTKWILHPNEQVHSLKDRKEMADPKNGKLRSRKELKEIVNYFDNGGLKIGDVMPNIELSQKRYEDSNELLKRVESVESALKSLPKEFGKHIPTGEAMFDEFHKALIYTSKKGNNIVKKGYLFD